MNLLLIAGARPNFMKVAPLIKAIQAHNAALAENSGQWTVDGGQSPTTVHRPLSTNYSGASSSINPSIHQSIIQYKLVHTGQHYDAKMSDIFFQELGIPAPDINLGVGSGSHAVQTAAIMTAFEPVLLNAFAAPPLSASGGEGRGEVASVAPGPSSSINPSIRQSSNLAFSLQPLAFPSPLPDWLLVVGDVNSTMACTLVASKLGVKVAHVEAGLRSFDRTMPEEINRIVTDSLADLLLTPSEDANENLRREGIPDAKIRLVGNIMIDALMSNLRQARASRLPGELGLKEKGFVYVTLHRPSNVDERQSLATIVAELERLAHRVPVVFPIHPRTRQRLIDFGITTDHRPPTTDHRLTSAFSLQPSALMFLEPIGYHDSLWLAENARLVLTDSGGLQEESTYFRTPCLTLRPNTERPITVSVGSNKLTSLNSLREDIQTAVNLPAHAGQVPPLWDGHTADRILAALANQAHPVPPVP